MRIIGLDLGTKTVGVAVSDYLGIIANPIGTLRIEENNLNQALELVKNVVKEQQAEKIVLGLPKNMDNSLGFASERSLSFKEKLESKQELKVNLIDERLSTVEAENILINADVSRKKRKNVIDELSACIILDTYLRKEGNK